MAQNDGCIRWGGSLDFPDTPEFGLTWAYTKILLEDFVYLAKPIPVFAVFAESLEDVNAFNERLKEVLFNEQSGILETWSALQQF